MAGRAIYEMVGPETDRPAAEVALARLMLDFLTMAWPGVSPRMTVLTLLPDARASLEPAYQAAGNGHLVAWQRPPARNWKCLRCGTAADWFPETCRGGTEAGNGA